MKPATVDLRHCKFVTIDGADSMDFDDAVYYIEWREAAPIALGES